MTENSVRSYTLLPLAGDIITRPKSTTNDKYVLSASEDGQLSSLLISLWQGVEEPQREVKFITETDKPHRCCHNF